MCGISGKVDFRGEVVDRALVSRMSSTIVHRGPDDEGIYTAPYVGLGQRRLAIIDLRHAAVAPLSNEDGTIWVTFNGEIYNFRELRSHLEEKGHTFRTNTDTEVIVHLYEEYGTDAVTHMDGMFAFAIWDAPRKRLVAARDRLGKKPFYYARTGDAFLFGSEIKAIMATGEVSSTPNWNAIDQYLTYQYVPSPLTAFEGIEKLPAGHLLVCNAATRNVRVERYWEPVARPVTTMTEEEICHEIVERLRKSVRMRLMSDVPLGAFLSGGVDSASVVALMAQESGERIKTFCIGFEDDSFDERPYARLTAERYGTEHHEFVVQPEAADVLPLLVHHYNEPFADASAIPTYYISKTTREHVTVALSGDGGDENFAGYDTYALALAWSRFDKIPSSLRRAAFVPAARAIEAMPYWNGGSRAARALLMAGTNTPERFRSFTTILKPMEKKAAYTEKFLDLIGTGTRQPVELQWSPDMDALDWMMRHDQHFYLPDCLMPKVDVASMANSLEVRSPLLDHHFVEFTATIPSHLKRDANGGKRIFKRAVKALVPDAVLNKRKTGFAVPLARWFRGELQPLLRETLLDETALRRGLFHQQFIRRMIEEHAASKRDWSTRLWALLFLELWFRHFID